MTKAIKASTPADKPISVLSELQLSAPWLTPYDSEAKASGPRIIPSLSIPGTWLRSEFGSFREPIRRQRMPMGILMRKIQRQE
ncbi:hypothetical protein D3C87_2066930 [compost metagenome]